MTEKTNTDEAFSEAKQAPQAEGKPKPKGKPLPEKQPPQERRIPIPTAEFSAIQRDIEQLRRDTRMRMTITDYFLELHERYGREYIAEIRRRLKEKHTKREPHS